MPMREQIDHILAPRQTTAEHNLALSVNDCLWVRTCYEPSLAPAFKEINRDIRKDASESCRLFDNRMLYESVGNDLIGLFLRLPQLPDTLYAGYPETEDLSLNLEPQEDGRKSRLYNAVLKEKSAM
jgi:hypothetical protein